ncbi:MAG: glycoside hydrolase family 88 protein [Candidatus Pseudobacter hemicellulosilyticus]|uniref:Glycoside hydrolase family 88 protein n=1 Tax=Candidatus Pseudobacter hemicellulosilyticus TaxID=3121375 RepID=A0AAJ6BFQ3_9BACT|nr:MAG: glycoside hydrolase family 88 protein [Pseudobacter sp.]
MKTVSPYLLLVILLLAGAIASAQSKPTATSRKSVKPDTKLSKRDILTVIQRTADWQLQHPTGKELNSWDYAPFYHGLMALYKTSMQQKYYDAIIDMGNTVRWEPLPRPYDANQLAIAQVFLELYELTGNKSMIDKSRYMMDMPMSRDLAPEVRFKDNKYWWEWWTWCDALYMAPPAYARLATITGQPRYMEYMVQNWWLTSDHLYSRTDSLFFRDDRFIEERSPNNKKIFWSRGNGWVVGGLARVLEYMPEDHPQRKRFVQQFVEMNHKLAGLQLDNGYWSQSLVDPAAYPQKETSGTAFFIYSMAWGINHHLLDKEKFLPVISKGWNALLEAVHTDGKLGYVQQVGDQPVDVKYEDAETYGSGAFILAGTALYQMLPD